jgi:sugar/nucleoside kinase (ribokinase family)
VLDLNPVLCIGELLIDFIASDNATTLEAAELFVARPGGAPANVAVALARLGVPSAFCGVVGDDPFGRRLRETLNSNGVGTSSLRQTNEDDTTIAFAWKNERGDGEFRILRLADRLINIDDIDGAALDLTAAIVVGSVSLAANPARVAVEHALQIATEKNIPICVDVNIRPSMWFSPEVARLVVSPVIESATLLKMSVDDARFLFDLEIDGNPDLIFAELHQLARPFTVLTDGSRGAWFALSTGEYTYVPPFPVQAVEPTGAGDAFSAAIISRLIRNGWSRLDADDVRFASAAGALTTTRQGAIDSLPTKEEVQSFLSANQKM